ncbi:DUF6443 domain-containing protein [Ohtaekwangia koreensis]|uniref:RHS repeat-associated core domain-containing protein n=1 Tax=Ohtaekwangia koreensis TaxID=688867 RepID=A0A1T5M9U1_9BACT|nr:DUF6443 domain-containing protein [Ohtaekwangia koreensis]SKC85021.1 RHS repeat-associated core domain-containing protein [Ohtaekwangia koreensis]
MKALQYIFFLLMITSIPSVCHSQQADVVTAQFKANQIEIVRVKGIKNETGLISLPQSSKLTGVRYQDGLGRTIANVSIQGSPTQKDLYNLPAYDHYGRIDTTYLPFVNSFSDGRWMHRWQAINAQKSFYNNAADKVADDIYPFGVRVLEASPIGLVKEEGSVGNGWQPGSGHTSKEVQRVNTANEVRIWKADATSTGYYAAASLQVFEVTDENGNKGLSFVDKLGKIVEKRIQSKVSTWLKTLFIYDEVGRLRYILQPEGVRQLGTLTSISAALLDNYSYSYVYDQRGRLVEKKVPGTAPIYYAYDPLDRLILIQDGNVRASNKWYFIKYDNKGRSVLEGLYTNTTYTTRAAIQTNVLDVLYSNTTDPYFEKKQSGSSHGYSNQCFPTANTEALVVKYYDDYDFDSNGTNDYSYIAQGFAEEGQQAEARGKITGAKSLIVGTSSWLVNYIFYDFKNRVIQVRSNNHLSLTADNLSSYEYNFDGSVKTTKVFHNAGGTNQTTVLNKYNYDHTGRLLRVYQSNNGSADQLLVQYEYNEIGELVDKKLHNTTGSNFLQSVDYRYTIKGALSSINNAQLIANSSNDEGDDYFGLELLYNTVETGLNNQTGDTVYWNGNIGAIKWKSVGYTSGQSDQRSYKFRYDKANRLTSATFQAYGTSWNKELNTLNETLTYDYNGNIKTLQRNRNLRGMSGLTVTSSPQAIDNLTYTYATSGVSNYLNKVEDAVTGTTGQAGFNNLVNTSNEYTYNTSGSILSDANKGITGTIYNDIGKASEVSFSDGKKITYIYDASGTKLNTKVFQNTTLLSSTDYVGSFVYDNNNLSFFGSPEGRVVKNGTTLEYQYAIADHQGNTRVLFTSSSATSQTATADFEAASNSSVDNYPSGGSRSGWDLFNHTGVGTTPTYSQLLNGGNNSQIGVSKSYTVYPGDKVKIEAYAKYYNVQSTNSNLSAFAAALTSAFGVTAASTGEAALKYQGLNAYGSVVAGGGGVGSNSFPKLFVNILIFDKNFKLLDIAFEQIDGGAQTGVTPKAAHDYMSREYTVKEAGYAFVYLSNESSTYVEGYFDDVTFTYTPGNILQYNEYYPFGLQTVNSWTRESNKNNYLYNAGSELNVTSGVYEMLFRNYDPALGRMLQIDPLAEKYSDISPFNYAFNDPVYWNDPAGADPNDPDHEVYTRPIIDEPGGVESGMIFVNGRLMNPRSSSGQRQWSGTDLQQAQYQYALAGFGGAGGISLGSVPLTNYPKDENGYYYGERLVDVSKDTWWDEEAGIQRYYKYYERLYFAPQGGQDGDGYRSRMSAQELSIFDNMTRGQQTAYLVNGNYAKGLAQELFSESTLFQGNGDAFRHALFSALNSRDLGLDLAKRLGDAHELHRNENPLGREMDLYNNQVGRDIFTLLNSRGLAQGHFSTENLAIVVMKAVAQGFLREIANGTLIPTKK